MRRWITLLSARPRLLIGIATGAVLAVVIIVGVVIAVGPGDSGEAPPTIAATPKPTASRTPSPTPTPTPTPTPSATETVSADPGSGSGSSAPAPAVPPADAPGQEPGVIGMEHGPQESCVPTTGQTVYLTFYYTANPGNTVDISYAYTDTDRQATSGFILLGSGMASSGSVSIPRTCPTEPTGFYPLITVQVVARTPNGSATAYYSGI